MKPFRWITPVGLLLEALVFLCLGCLMLFAPRLVVGFGFLLLLIALLGSSVLSLLGFAFVHKLRRAQTLWRAGLSLGLAALLVAFPRALGFGVGAFVGVWALVNAVVALMFAWQLYRTGNPWVRQLLEGIVHLTLSVAMLTQPIGRLTLVNTLAAVYLLVLGISRLGEFAAELLHWDETGRHVKRKLRMHPPVLLTAFLPTQWLEKINRALEIEPAHAAQWAWGGVEENRLEVLFHLGKDVAFGFGHVDLCFEGTCYSYGCYDEKSNRFFGLLSDGVLAIAERDIYLRHAICAEKKKLVGFSLALTQEQAGKVHEAIERLVAIGTPWQADGDAAGLQYLKLRQGPYQVYNAFKTNCVALAEMVVGETGLPILPMNGIITPGTYLSYMERQFAKKNRMVAGCRVYTDI